MDTIPLSELPAGQSACVQQLENPAAMRRRLLDLGLVPGCVVSCVGISPCGDPAAYRICQAVVALRREDSHLIWVSPLEGAESLWV